MHAAPGARRRSSKHQLGGLGIDERVALRGAGDAVRPVQAGVEPLRRIGRADLAGQHRAHLFVVDLGVVLGIEIPVLVAPVRPRPGEPMEDLAGIGLGAEGRAVHGLGTPQPRRNIRFFNALEGAGDARFAEVLLGDDIGRDLTPCRRNLDVLASKIVDPLGLTMREVRGSNATPAYGSPGEE